MNLAELRREAKQAFDNHQASQHQAILDHFPAQEFFWCIHETSPLNYCEIWKSAGGKVYENGRMIALKNDPIWASISKFGLPYPPFDKYNVMWVRDVSRSEAIRLGVSLPDQKIAPQFRNWNDDRKLITRSPQK